MKIRNFATQPTLPLHTMRHLLHLLTLLAVLTGMLTTACRPSGSAQTDDKQTDTAFFFRHARLIKLHVCNGYEKVVVQNPWDTTRSTLPEGFGCKVLALCQLLVCRNAWWKQLGWEPDWKNGIKKYCITCIGGEISNQSVYQSASILVFPTEEARNQFFESFRDLIEEAKELI